MNPTDLLKYTWPGWTAIYEEYRISKVTAEIRPVQGTNTVGISAFWFDPNGGTSPSLSQASARWVKTVKNNNLSSSLHLISYEFKEIENLSYKSTNIPTAFTDTTFCGYTESTVFDSPNTTQLYLIRFRLDIKFKNLRTVE